MAVTEAPRIVTARMGHDDSYTLDRFLATGGYDGLRKALTMTPEAVAAEVDAVAAAPASRPAASGRCSVRTRSRTS
jgi:NADH:ubiquinone oxidoreductase subunit F (NADH-binding)